MAAKAAAVKAKERRGKKNCRSLSVTDGLVVPEEGERRQESVCSRLLFFALEGLFGFPFFCLLLSALLSVALFPFNQICVSRPSASFDVGASP